MPRNLFMNHESEDSEDVPEEEPKDEETQTLYVDDLPYATHPETGFTTTERAIQANRERLLGGDDGEVRE